MVIEGPGRVTTFNTGLLVTGANNKVTGVFVGDCYWAIRITATANELEGNTVAGTHGFQPYGLPPELGLRPPEEVL